MGIITYTKKNGKKMVMKNENEMELNKADSEMIWRIPITMKKILNSDVNLVPWGQIG